MYLRAHPDDLNTFRGIANGVLYGALLWALGYVAWRLATGG